MSNLAMSDVAPTGVLLITDHDTRWQVLPGDASDTVRQLRRWLTPRPEHISITSRAALWIGNRDLRRGEPNVLASALLTFLHLPTEQLVGPALLTASVAGTAAPLSDLQLRAFTHALRILLTQPNYLGLHRQAGQLASYWSCTTTDRRSN